MSRHFHPLHGNPNEQVPGELTRECARLTVSAHHSLEAACRYLSQLYYCCIKDNNGQVAQQTERKLIALSAVVGVDFVRELVIPELGESLNRRMESWLQRTLQKLDRAETLEQSMMLPPDV